MVMGDESSSRRARWVPRAARTVGRVRRAAGGGRHRGHWTGTEAAVVLVPHLRLMLPGRFAATVDVAERQELLCFRRRPLSILCCALCFLSRSDDAGGDADEAEEDYEEELHACVDSPLPPASVSSFSSHRRKRREREGGAWGNGIGEGLLRVVAKMANKRLVALVLPRVTGHMSRVERRRRTARADRGGTHVTAGTAACVSISTTSPARVSHGSARLDATTNRARVAHRSGGLVLTSSLRRYGGAGSVT
uniref:Uncharacterized protein n=1 Tax=Oryza rufipogon TaxID=4529 RepID=A0A0E0MV42_ORYRU